MRVVFMGTSRFAALILERIAEVHEVAGVITRPDAVRDRGNAKQPSEVADAAVSRGLTVLKPETLKDGSIQSDLRSLQPDVICVAAYGALLPREMLDMPRFGCLNVHGSLLPRWRGAAPIERAILAHDESAGVCVMRMEEGLDTGAHCAMRSVPIDSKTAAELETELAALGAEALLEVLEALEAGRTLVWVEQDDAMATYAEKIGKGELDIEPGMDAYEIDARVRASSDAHPSRAQIAGRVVSVSNVRVPEDAVSSELGKHEPGEVLQHAKKVYLSCSDGFVELLTLKPQGKKEMEAKAFCAGVQDFKKNGASWGGLND